LRHKVKSCQTGIFTDLKAVMVRRRGDKYVLETTQFCAVDSLLDNEFAPPKPRN
jgi:hypothetical protein